jgi:hypothetical protein
VIESLFLKIKIKINFINLGIDWLKNFFVVKMNNFKGDVLNILSDKIKNYAFAVIINYLDIFYKLNNIIIFFLFR